MAPSPEYDKEPKAPDKNITGAPNEELKNPLGVVSDQINSDQKATTVLADGEIEERKVAESAEDDPWRGALDDAAVHGKGAKDRDKATNLFKENKHVETLDDGQLRALLDEAITYKCPKDREGKSSLFKELLEEVEQDEQAGEAEGADGGRARNPRALSACGSNSLQDIVAALAAEAAPRRRHAPVSARTHHGGSLPSGVDKSFLLSEEPMRGGGGSGIAGLVSGGGAEYVATVRCVNPEPLAERRVSASDTSYNATEMEMLNRRSKVPMFPAMYTARTTLEIGGGSVCTGRAVTTTTASNQVRTRPPGPPTAGPPERIYDRRPGRANAPAPAAATNGGGRPPRGQHAPPAPGPAPSHRRSYDLEAYCRRKCKEDSVRNSKSAKGQRRFDPHNKHNQGRNCVNEPHETQQHVEKYTFHSTDVPTYIKGTCYVPQTCRNDSVSDFVFGESGNDSSEQNVNVEERCKNIDKTVTDVVVASLSMQANAKVTSSMTPVRTKLGQEMSTRNETAECASVQNENRQINYTGNKSNDHSKTRVGNYCDNGCLGKVSENKSLVSNSEKHSLLDEVIPDRSQMYSNKESESKQSSTETWGQNSTNINSERGSVLRSEIKIDIDDCDDGTLMSSNVPKEHKNLSQVTDDSNANTGAISKIIREDQNVTCKGSNLREIQRSIINLKHKIKVKPVDTISKRDMETSDVDKIIEEAITDYVDGERSGVANERDIDSEILIRNARENNTTLDAYASKVGDVPRTTYALVTLPVYEQNTDQAKYAESAEGATSGSDAGTITADYSKTAFVLLPLVKHSKDEVTESDDRLYNLKPLNLSENAGLISNSLIPILGENDSSTNEILIFEPSRSDGDAANIDNKGQVDAGVPFNCITTPEVVAGCVPTASAAAVDPKPRSVIASSFNGLPLTRGSYGANTVAPPDDYKKSVDENGNAVQNLTPLCSTLYGSNQHKKPRRKKSSKNETIIDLNLVDGYRGDKDVTELLRFIEPDAEHGRGQKLGRLAKHRDDDKKRSTERRAKDKESKVKRASSLEELSRTKLEDLTDKPPAPITTVTATATARHKKDAAAAHGPPKTERRSWGDDARDSYFYADADEVHATTTAPETVSSAGAPVAGTAPTAVAVVSLHAPVTPPTVKEKKKGKSGSKSADSTPVSAATATSPQEPHSDTTVELMDFQTVTKKRKQRKRFEEGDRDVSAGDLCYRKPKPASPERRRKSAPPSDKSNDSNDDMDSVHSLPADTAAERASATAAAHSAAGTPHASYADIARTRHNIPDLIESCNYYIDVDAAAGPGACPDADDKPRRLDLPPSVLPPPPAPAVVAPLPETPRRADDAHAYDPEGYPALDCRTQRAKPKESKTSPPNKKPEKKTRSLPDQSLDERGVTAHRVPAAGKTTQLDDAVVENCTESAIVGGGMGAAEGGESPLGGVEGADGSPPDVVSDRRPPVILLDEAARPRDMDGITFGFDVNEQLLNGEGEGCDLVPGVPVRSGLRYLPPRQHQHTPYHHQIVNYVGTAWEDIIRCGSGKVRYFSE